MKLSQVRAGAYPGRDFVFEHVPHIELEGMEIVSDVFSPTTGSTNANGAIAQQKVAPNGGSEAKDETETTDNPPSVN